MPDEMKEVGEVKISKELNYKKMIGSGPAYRYTRLLQQSGGEEQKLLINSSSTSIFELPSDVMNLSKSKLMWVMNAPEENKKSIKIRTNYPPIRRIVLKTRNGKTLVDIPNFPAFWVMVKDHCNSELYGRIGSDSAADMKNDALRIAAAKITGVCNFHNRTHDGSSTITAAGSYNGKISADGTADTTNAAIYDTEQILVSSILEDDDNDGDGDISVHCCLYLGDIFHTLFAIDKNLFFNESMNMEVEWLEGNKFVYTTTALNTVSTGAAAYTSTVNVSELALYLAIEQNDHNRNALMSKIASDGLHLMVPYVHVNSQNLGTGTSVSTQVKYNRGHGKSLLRVYTAERLTADEKNTQNIFYNVNGVLTSSFYHQINSKRYEDNDIDEKSFDAYHLQDYLNKGSLVAKLGPLEYYKKCPSYVVDFSACTSLVHSRSCDLDASGIDLSQEVLFNKVITKSATDSTSFFVAVCQKDLLVSNNGVSIM